MISERRVPARFEGTPLTPSWIGALSTQTALLTGKSTYSAPSPAHLAGGMRTRPLQIPLGSMNLQSALFGVLFSKSHTNLCFPWLSEKEDFPELKEAGPRGRAGSGLDPPSSLSDYQLLKLRPWRILTNPGTSFVEWLRQALGRQL